VDHGSCHIAHVPQYDQCPFEPTIGLGNLSFSEGTPSRNLEELVGAKGGHTDHHPATPKPTSGNPINPQDRDDTARRL
jgi:hypothetical protein